MWPVSPRDDSRCPSFSSCRSVSQSEDEDEAQLHNTTNAKNSNKFQTGAGLCRQVRCIIGLFASAPRKTTLDREFTQIHRMHVGYFYFSAFTGTSQERNESWQSIFCVFGLHIFVGSIISTSGDPSLTFAHLCHGALWSCIWPRWCWNMLKHTLKQFHKHAQHEWNWFQPICGIRYSKVYTVSSILILIILLLDGRVWFWWLKHHELVMTFPSLEFRVLKGDEKGALPVQSWAIHFSIQ